MFDELLRVNDTHELYSEWGNKTLPEPFNKISLQHQFYSTIYRYSETCKVNFNDNLKVISIVRNPYDRIMSDIFWLSRGKFVFFNKTPTPENTYDAIEKFLNISPEQVDNHNIPQYKYFTNQAGELYKNIKIFKLENLHDSNEEINRFLNTELIIKKKPIRKYDDLLNKESIKLINDFYKKDFELFGYDMKFIV